eukprot:2937776-Pleurochrysis_carterae.AAC.1
MQPSRCRSQTDPLDARVDLSESGLQVWACVRVFAAFCMPEWSHSYACGFLCSCTSDRTRLSSRMRVPWRAPTYMRLRRLSTVSPRTCWSINVLCICADLATNAPQMHRKCTTHAACYWPAGASSGTNEGVCVHVRTQMRVRECLYVHACACVCVSAHAACACVRVYACVCTRACRARACVRVRAHVLLHSFVLTRACAEALVRA